MLKINSLIFIIFFFLYTLTSSFLLNSITNFSSKFVPLSSQISSSKLFHLSCGLSSRNKLLRLSATSSLTSSSFFSTFRFSKISSNNNSRDSNKDLPSYLSSSSSPSTSPISSTGEYLTKKRKKNSPSPNLKKELKNINNKKTNSLQSSPSSNSSNNSDMFSFPTSPASISTESGCIPHNPQLIEVPAAELIKLTHEEENLFNILRNCIAKNNMTTVLRVAGGWVRDKLLGKESHDIDIALDNISGQAFANILNAYLNEIGEKTRAIAVIQANPDQSKHLETANVRVLNKEIDFVNLRSETYTNTRIPEIKIGTPLEDALRRDFTINSLFYNINSNKIEDYTTRGIHDLKNGILRTPITPFITFKDDPLRVLRAIRFCSRFNFKLCKDLIAASHNNSIKNELNVKISKERIYKECDGMYGHSTSRPFLGFLLMYRLNILDVVLNLSEKLNENQRDKNKITLNSDISSSYFDKISNNLINYLNTLASNKEKINSIETIFPTNITNGKWLYTSIQILFYINILKQLEHHEPFQHVMRDPSSLTLHKVYKDSSLDFHNRHEVAEVYLGEEVEAIESIDNSNHVETIKNLQCKEQDTLEIDKDSYFFYDKDTNYDIYSNIDELKQFKHFKVSIYNQLACQNDTNLKHLHWAALTFPITHLNFLEKKKNIPLSQIVLRDSLKMEKVGSKNVEKLHEAAISFLSVASPDNIDIETAGKSN